MLDTCEIRDFYSANTFMKVLLKRQMAKQRRISQAFLKQRLLVLQHNHKIYESVWQWESYK